MNRHQPQIVSRSREGVRVALVSKNFAAASNPSISHIGLGVCAILTAKSLRAAGFDVEVWQCSTAMDLKVRLNAAQASATSRGLHPISHVVVSAPWIPIVEMQQILTSYPDVHFATVSHSNVGFLAADPNGIKLLRQSIELQAGYHNFTLGGNCRKYTDAWQAMYGAPVTFLPNLYDVSAIKHVGQRLPWHRGQTLRVGVFGATRPLKNMVTAVAAAVELGNTLKNDVEVWVSSGREEGGGSVKNAILQLVEGLPHTRLVEAGWRSWPAFTQIVGNMHVLMSPSYTESYNICVADGIAQGVASVVSEAIDWVPQDWVANADNVGSIARTARRLLHDTHAVSEGQEHLRSYVRHGLTAWEGFLV